MISSVVTSAFVHRPGSPAAVDVPATGGSAPRHVRAPEQAILNVVEAGRAGDRDAAECCDSDGDEQPIAVSRLGDDLWDRGCNKQSAYRAGAAPRIDPSEIEVRTDPRVPLTRNSPIASGAVNCEVDVTGRCVGGR